MKHSWKSLSLSFSILSLSLPSLICLPTFSGCPAEHAHTQLAPSTVPAAPQALCTVAQPSPPSLGQMLFPACSHDASHPCPIPHPCPGFAAGQPMGSPQSSAPASLSLQGPSQLVLHPHGDEGMSAGTGVFGGCLGWSKVMEMLLSSYQTSTSVSLKSPFLAEGNGHMVRMVCKEQGPDRAQFTQS